MNGEQILVCSKNKTQDFLVLHGSIFLKIMQKIHFVYMLDSSNYKHFIVVVLNLHEHLEQDISGSCLLHTSSAPIYCD